MEEQTTAATSKPKKKYIRKRRTDLALESALRDAAIVAGRSVDPSVLNLLRARLMVLNQRLRHEENGKIKRLAEEVASLRTENQKLKAEFAQALSQIETQRRVPVVGNETLDQKAARLLQTFDRRNDEVRL